MKIRLARPEDAQALLDIYGQYIHTPITFEYQLPTREEFARRIRDTLERYPYLVWEREGRSAGYAYAHLQRERAAYQWNAELSIYLDRDAVGRGGGRGLYTALLELLRLQGVQTASASVTVPNPASQALHRSMGFRETGLSPKTGYKGGAWHDVVFFEKPLGDYAPAPAPVTPLPKLPAGEVEAVLGGLRER